MLGGKLKKKKNKTLSANNSISSKTVHKKKNEGKIRAFSYKQMEVMPYQQIFSTKMLKKVLQAEVKDTKW